MLLSDKPICNAIPKFWCDHPISKVRMLRSIYQRSLNGRTARQLHISNKQFQSTVGTITKEHFCAVVFDCDVSRAIDDSVEVIWWGAALIPILILIG